QPAVEAVDQPFLDSARIESHYRQPITHPFEPNRSERLGPHGTKHHRRSFPIVFLDFVLRNEALEVHARFQSELPAQLLAVRSVIAVAQNDALEGHFYPGKRFKQYVHAFAANNLARKDQQVPAEVAPQGRFTRTRHRWKHVDFFDIEAVAHEFLAHV